MQEWIKFFEQYKEGVLEKIGQREKTPQRQELTREEWEAWDQWENALKALENTDRDPVTTIEQKLQAVEREMEEDFKQLLPLLHAKLEIKEREAAGAGARRKLAALEADMTAKEITQILRRHREKFGGPSDLPPEPVSPIKLSPEVVELLDQTTSNLNSKIRRLIDSLPEGLNEYRRYRRNRRAFAGGLHLLAYLVVLAIGVDLVKDLFPLQWWLKLALTTAVWVIIEFLVDPHLKRWFRRRSHQDLWRATNYLFVKKLESIYDAALANHAVSGKRLL